MCGGGAHPSHPLLPSSLLARYLDFTFDPIKYQGLPEFVDKLHNELNMHVCPSTSWGERGLSRCWLFTP